MELYLKSITDEESHIEQRRELLISFSEFKDLVRFEEFRKLEKEYLPKFIE